MRELFIVNSTRGPAICRGLSCYISMNNSNDAIPQLQRVTSPGAADHFRGRPRKGFSNGAPSAIQEACETEDASAEQDKGAGLGRGGNSDKVLRHRIA